MKFQDNTAAISIDNVCHVAIRRLSGLRARMALGLNVVRPLQEFHTVLESLPLATSEFGLAKNRLNNAIHYLATDQRGAARYELQLLEGSLKHWSDCLSCHPRPVRKSPVRKSTVHRVTF